MPLQIIMFRICSKRKLKLTQPRNQDWEWLIVRGQARHDAREAEQRGLPSSLAGNLPIRDYGAYAIEGSLWSRIAATRGDYAAHAAHAFAKFSETYQAEPLEHYRSLASWVEDQAIKPIKSLAEPNSPLADARDLQIRAKELKRGRDTGTNAYQLAPALAACRA